MPDGIRFAVDPISVQQTISPTAATSKRIPTLDGLRAVSIVLVLLNHLVGTLYYPAILSPLGEFGNFGVRVFFVISGYHYFAANQGTRTNRVNLAEEFLSAPGIPHFSGSLHLPSGSRGLEREVPHTPPA